MVVSAAEFTEESWEHFWKWFGKGLFHYQTEKDKLQKKQNHLCPSAAAMQVSPCSRSLCLSLRLGAPSQPEDFLGGQSAGAENQFVKGKKSERSPVPLLFFCLLWIVNPLSVFIHGRQRYYLVPAGNVRALHTTIALAQLLKQRQKLQQQQLCSEWLGMQEAGTLITVCGHSGGWRDLEVKGKSGGVVAMWTHWADSCPVRQLPRLPALAPFRLHA